MRRLRHEIQRLEYVLADMATQKDRLRDENSRLQRRLQATDQRQARELQNCMEHLSNLNQRGIEILQRTNTMIQRGGTAEDVQRSLSELYNLFRGG